jgi:hypothetical protein
MEQIKVHYFFDNFFFKIILLKIIDNQLVKSSLKIDWPKILKIGI